MVKELPGMKSAGVRHEDGRHSPGYWGNRHKDAAGSTDQLPGAAHPPDGRPTKSGRCGPARRLTAPEERGWRAAGCADLDLQSEVAVSLNADVRGRQKGPWTHHTVALRSPMAAYRVSW